MAAHDAGMTALGNRAHLVAAPAARDRLIHCFTAVLGCGDPLRMTVPGVAEPILAFRFPNGGSISVEFTERALDEGQARQGAWLELVTDDPGALQRKIVDAGLPRLTSLLSDRFYFVLPGGQVMGVVGS